MDTHTIDLNMVYTNKGLLGNNINWQGLRNEGANGWKIHGVIGLDVASLA